MDSDINLSDETSLHNSDNVATIVLTGSNLQSDMEFVSHSGLHAEQITMSTIENAIPYIIGSQNHTHVAEEVEIETSSVGGCEENINHGNDFLKYDCEITVTLSPVPSSTSSASTDTATESIVECDSNQYMEIVVHPVDPSKENVSRHVVAAATSRTTTDYKVSDVKAVRSTIHKSMVSLVTEEKMLERESTTITQEYSSMNERADAYINSSVAPWEPMITTTHQGTSRGKGKTVMECGKEVVNRSLSSKKGRAGVSILEKSRELDTRTLAPVRASCIKWAKKVDVTDIVPGPSSVVEIVTPNQRNSFQQKLNTARRTKAVDENKCNFINSGVLSNAWITTRTTTSNEHKTVNILEEQPSSSLMKKGIWPYLPFWIDYSQIQAYCLPSRPPGFEDPPETEWLDAVVHHVDPSDGALRYKCRSCEGVVQQRSTKQKYQLNYSRLRYQCIQCSRKYITRKQLKHHLLRHNEKTRVCHFCDKRFLTQNELKNHLNTHTGERPHRCPVCFMSFAHSSRYYSHIRNIHRKYECKVCYAKMCLSSGNAASPKNVKNSQNSCT